MNKKIFLSLLLTLLLFAACGEGAAPPAIEIDTSVGLFAEAVETLEDIDAGEISVFQADRGAAVPIHWGTPMLNTDIDAASPILQYFLDKFNIDLSLMRVPFDLASGDPIPDIFVGNAANLYERGFTRTIPRAMIELYAPNYAAVLSSTPYGWEMGRVGDTDEYAGLFIYDITRAYLKDFSAYRLDWMEQLGIQPPGELIEIGDGVYFSPDSFNMAEFMHVMRQFSVNDLSELDAYTRGIGLYLTTMNVADFNTIHDPAASLMGMWGINLDNINENGKATPYFASDAYKEFLLFVRQTGHYNDDYIIYVGNDTFPRGFPVSVPSQYEAGWSSLHLDSLYMIMERQRNLPTNRYLITPPEIGPSGLRGGGAKHNGSLFDQDGQWVISSTVSDALLINILQLFNALAFDPETFVTARFGIEGRDYSWEGEPYHSRIIPANNYRSRQRNGVGMFDAQTWDGNAGKWMYYTGSHVLYEYAMSDIGRSLVIWPYKDDLSGKSAAVFNGGVRSIKQELQNTSRGWYYYFLFAEDANIEAEWDLYLNELYEIGLQEYMDYLEILDEVVH
jgi:hypothetical protein